MCVSPLHEDVPSSRFHHQIRHPRGRCLIHRRSLVVQDKHLILTDFCHKVEVLLQTHSREECKYIRADKHLSQIRCDLNLKKCLPEPCRCDRSDQLMWLQRRDAHVNKKTLLL